MQTLLFIHISHVFHLVNNNIIQDRNYTIVFLIFEVNESSLKLQHIAPRPALAIKVSFLPFNNICTATSLF